MLDCAEPDPGQPLGGYDGDQVGQVLSPRLRSLLNPDMPEALGLPDCRLSGGAAHAGDAPNLVDRKSQKPWRFTSPLMTHSTARWPSV